MGFSRGLGEPVDPGLHPPPISPWAPPLVVTLLAGALAAPLAAAGQEARRIARIGYLGNSPASSQKAVAVKQATSAILYHHADHHRSRAGVAGPSQGVALIEDVLPAREIVERMAREAEAIVTQRLPWLVR